jgi:hypothetical protein
MNTYLLGFSPASASVGHPGEALLKQVIRVAPKAQAPQGPRRTFAEGYFLGVLRSSVPRMHVEIQGHRKRKPNLRVFLHACLPAGVISSKGCQSLAFGSEVFGFCLSEF